MNREYISSFGTQNSYKVKLSCFLILDRQLTFSFMAGWDQTAKDAMRLDDRMARTVIALRVRVCELDLYSHRGCGYEFIPTSRGSSSRSIQFLV